MKMTRTMPHLSLQCSRQLASRHMQPRVTYYLTTNALLNRLWHDNLGFHSVVRSILHPLFAIASDWKRPRHPQGWSLVWVAKSWNRHCHRRRKLQGMVCVPFALRPGCDFQAKAVVVVRYSRRLRHWNNLLLRDPVTKVSTECRNHSIMTLPSIRRVVVAAFELCITC